jgi:hypothetical protein
MGDVFDLARNEFLEVDLFPTMIASPDNPSQYTQRSGGFSYTPNMEQEDSWNPQMIGKLPQTTNARRSTTTYNGLAGTGATSQSAWSYATGTSWKRAAIFCARESGHHHAV